MARGQEEQGHGYTTISPGFTAFSDPYACMQSASPNEPSPQSLQQYTLTKKMLTQVSSTSSNVHSPSPRFAVLC